MTGIYRPPWSAGPAGHPPADEHLLKVTLAAGCPLQQQQSQRLSVTGLLQQVLRNSLIYATAGPAHCHIMRQFHHQVILESCRCRMPASKGSCSAGYVAAPPGLMQSRIVCDSEVLVDSVQQTATQQQ